ncbi:MAG: hypothetical protein D6820_04475, partial [Lentisphaerae bacterium]
YKGGKFSGEEAWQQKYAERQAALNAFSASPLFGVGIGNYQRVINLYFEEAIDPALTIEKSPRNLMERGGHGALWVLLCETGAAGTLSLLCFLLVCLIAGNPSQSAEDAGFTAAVAVLVCSLFWGSFLVRGLNFIAAFLLAGAWGRNTSRG